MITKQNIYKYLTYRQILCGFNSIEILSIHPGRNFITINYEYVENERINQSMYNIQKDLYYKWIISNRKNKIKVIENI